MHLPTELVLQILDRNLSPRNHRSRTNHLLSYCLINKQFRTIFQPKMLEHLNLEGDAAKVGKVLGVVRHLLDIGGEETRGGVRTIECTLTLDFDQTSEDDQPNLPQDIVQMVEQCWNVTELTLVGVSPLDLYSLLVHLREWVFVAFELSRTRSFIKYKSTKANLRVLHLSTCYVREWPTETPYATADSLHYLALDRTIFPASITKHFQHLRGLSDYNEEFGLMDMAENGLILPRITSLRLGGDVLEQIDLSSALPSARSLDTFRHPNVKRLWSPLFEQLHRLHSAATPQNCKFLASKVEDGSLSLRELFLSLNRNVEINPDDETFKDLEVACKKHGVRLRIGTYVERSQCAVEFWQQCTGEAFLINGFVDAR